MSNRTIAAHYNPTGEGSTLEPTITLIAGGARVHLTLKEAVLAADRLEAATLLAHRDLNAAAQARRDGHGNTVAREGCDRCDCGSKYWERDHCVSCGQHVTARSEARA